jgi:nucleotide-binding universal stress UspA family protein
VLHKFPSQVVCGVDFSDVSAEALRLAALLAMKAGARLSCVHAVAPEAPIYFTGANLPELERQGRESLIREHAALKAFVGRITDADDVDLRVGEGRAAALILGTADDTGADMIVVGTQGRSAVERFWLGSVAEAVVRDARVPVLVVPSTSAGPKSGKVVCVVRNSDISRTALNRPAILAGALGAELVVVNVLDHAQSGRTAQDLCAWASAERACSVQYIEKPAHAPAQLLDHIDAPGADLIVLGFERGRFSVRTEHGFSIPDALRHARTPILLIPNEYVNEAHTSDNVQQDAG